MSESTTAPRARLSVAEGHVEHLREEHDLSDVDEKDGHRLYTDWDLKMHVCVDCALASANPTLIRKADCIDDRDGPRRPTIFSTDAAFEHLDEHGQVLTARAEKKPSGPVWVRRSRTGPKEFDAYRHHVRSFKTIHPQFYEFAQRFYGSAGFEYAESWVSAYRAHQDVEPIHIYLIEKEGDG